MLPELARFPIRTFHHVLWYQSSVHDQRSNRSWTIRVFPGPGATRP